MVANSIFVAVLSMFLFVNADDDADNSPSLSPTNQSLKKMIQVVPPHLSLPKPSPTQLPRPTVIGFKSPTLQRWLRALYDDDDASNDDTCTLSLPFSSNLSQFLSNLSQFSPCLHHCACFGAVLGSGNFSYSPNGV